MGEDKCTRIRIILLSIVGLLWLIRGFTKNNVVFMVIGVSLILGWVSIFLTTYIRSDSKIKRIIEVASGAIALGVIVYGYMLSRDLVLMIFTILIFAFFTLAFMLSYLLPKIMLKIRKVD